MENSPFFNFSEIWPETMYYIVQGLGPDFGAILKICKKSNFDLCIRKSIYIPCYAQ